MAIKSHNAPFYFAYLRVIAEFRLVVEHIQERVTVIRRMQVNGLRGWRHELRIAKRLQRFVPVSGRPSGSV